MSKKRVARSGLARSHAVRGYGHQLATLPCPNNTVATQGLRVQSHQFSLQARTWKQIAARLPVLYAIVAMPGQENPKRTGTGIEKCTR